MKLCPACSTEKPLSEFYAHPTTRDKHFNTCKKCVLAHSKLHRQDDPITYLLYAAKNRAKQKGIPFSITASDLVAHTHCPVFGFPLVYGETGTGARGYGVKDNAATIDRIDGAKGYVPGNVNIISWKANRTKAFLTPTEIQQLAAFFKP
jgi:hypothetical protein